MRGAFGERMQCYEIIKKNVMEENGRKFALLLYLQCYV
jgi:hypothetical protein